MNTTVKNAADVVVGDAVFVSDRFYFVGSITYDGGNAWFDLYRDVERTDLMMQYPLVVDSPVLTAV